MDSPTSCLTGTLETGTSDVTVPTFRAIVFDLDGVLIDSMPCHRAAFEEVFRPFGVTGFDSLMYAGWKTADVVERVLRQHPDAVADVTRRKSELAREKMAASNPIYPDCLAVLKELAPRYALGLASSGARQSVQQFLTTNQCESLFQSVLSGEDVGRAKPDPEIYERSFARLNVSPVEGVVIEDAVAGIQSANAAGAGAIIGIAGTCSSGQLMEAGATVVIGSLSEILQTL